MEQRARDDERERFQHRLVQRNDDEREHHVQR